jgi:hypothetical protein
MKKTELLRALQSEIRRHTFDYFVENPPAMADGGHGVVVPGCPACRKRINTMAQFLDHLRMNSMHPYNKKELNACLSMTLHKRSTFLPTAKECDANGATGETHQEICRFPAGRRVASSPLIRTHTRWQSCPKAFHYPPADASRFRIASY